MWYGTDKLVYFYGEGTQGLSYTKTGSSLQVSGIGTSTGTKIVIPVKTYEFLDQNTIYNVTSIGRGAFLNNTVLKTIDISSCSHIYPNAFKGCINLASVRFPLKSGHTYYEWSVLNPDTGLALMIDPNSSGFDGAKLLTDTYVGWEWRRGS